MCDRMENYIVVETEHRIIKTRIVSAFVILISYKAKSNVEYEFCFWLIVSCLGTLNDRNERQNVRVTHDLSKINSANAMPDRII